MGYKREFGKRIIINLATFCSTAFQPAQRLLGILNLREPRLAVLPEVEEFFVMLYGFVFPAFL